jgi:hypothetical protein
MSQHSRRVSDSVGGVISNVLHLAASQCLGRLILGLRLGFGVTACLYLLRDPARDYCSLVDVALCLFWGVYREFSFWFLSLFLLVPFLYAEGTSLTTSLRYQDLASSAPYFKSASCGWTSDLEDSQNADCVPQFGIKSWDKSS